MICIILIICASVGELAGQATDRPAAAPCVDGTATLSAACRAALAERFAPTLIVAPGGCNWDTSTRRLGGGYFFAVERLDTVVRIAYLPAYFMDCGWRGPKCWLPGVDCSPHAGDSEFIAVDVFADSVNGWRVVGVFLSAHCFGRSSSNCRWYRGKELATFGWQGSSPEVWVADGRNANYPSRTACDRGHHNIDTCDRNTARYRIPIDSARDIGSRSSPARDGGCYAGSELATPVGEPRAVECFWRDQPFRGWISSAPGVTGYNRYLREVARF